MDLLGAGPSTVEELRSIAGRLRLKYQAQLEAKEKRAELPPPREQLRQATGQAVSSATSAAAGMFERIKTTTKIASPTFSLGRRGAKKTPEQPKSPPSPQVPTKQETEQEIATQMEAKAPTIEQMLFGDDAGDNDGLVVGDGDEGKDVLSAVANFSIGDDDDDDEEMDLDKLLNQ